MEVEGAVAAGLLGQIDFIAVLVSTGQGDRHALEQGVGRVDCFACKLVVVNNAFDRAVGDEAEHDATEGLGAVVWRDRDVIEVDGRAESIRA